MKQKLEHYGQRFESLQLRERLLILITVLTAIVVLGYLMVIEPQLMRLKVAEQQLTQQKNDLADIKQKTVFTTTNVSNPDSAAQANINQVQLKAAEAAVRLKTIGQTLVAPDRVTGLLDDILKRNHRVELVSLRNLPPSDVIERKDKAKTKDNVDAGSLSPDLANASVILKNQGIDVLKPRVEYDLDAIDGVLFKHGVEITVAGSYGDLVNYLTDLEKMPQRLLWSSVKLTVEEYPRARMTFVVYTLSLDKAWLVV